MTLSEKEKALIILEESTNAFNECQKQLNETGKAFLECKRALNSANTYLKMVLNYIMGRYTGLAFEVSRHKKCIDDLRKDGDV